MSQPETKFVRAAQVRRSLTQPGDIRAEVAYQNDINALLARFDEVKVPWRALAGPAQTIPPSIVADDTPVPSPLPAQRPRIKRIDVTFPRLRVVDGGAPAVGPSLDLVPVVAAPAAPRVALQTTPPPRVIPVPGRTTTAARTPRRRG